MDKHSKNITRPSGNPSIREDQFFEIVGANYLPLTGLPPGKKRPLQGFPKLACLVLLIIVSGCLFCDLFIGPDPGRLDPGAIDLAPDSSHWFGTDTMGRDLWSIIWFGGRKSLLIGALATLITTTIAVIYGTVSGLAGKAVDSIMMRFT